MASSWNPPQRPPAERPWMGMALLAAIPLLSLILIRMLWSGSGLWFLSVGIILLGAAAIFFIARRPQELEYDRQIMGQESNRVPLILTGLGVLFLALLLLPNFAGGGSDSELPSLQQSPSTTTSDVAESIQPPAAESLVAEPSEPVAAPPPAETTLTSDGGVYVIESGDTIWDIASRFGTTVEAIVEANDMENPAELQVGQEIVIPAADETASADEETEPAAVAP